MNTFEVFDVPKNNVRVSSMSNSLNLVKPLLGLKFDVRLFEAKNRVFEFDHQRDNLGCLTKAKFVYNSLHYWRVIIQLSDTNPHFFSKNATFTSH